jgi:addiction module HigA family antidote
MPFLLTTSTITELEHHMTRMHNPPHPGEVLREYLGNITVTDAAARLGVGRVTLQRVVTGAAGISPDMAYRLGMAFGTSPELWAGMQLQYDLHQAGKVERPKIERIAA